MRKGFLFLLSHLFLVLAFFVMPVDKIQAQFPASATLVIPFRGREYWQDFDKPRKLLDYLEQEEILSLYFEKFIIGQLSVEEMLQAVENKLNSLVQ